jgi:predicted nucleotidyltransferase
MLEIRTIAETYALKELLQHSLLKNFSASLSLAIVGSVASGHADEHSDIDLLAVLPDTEFSQLSCTLKENPHLNSDLPSIVENTTPEITTKIRAINWIIDEVDRDFVIMSYILSTAKIILDPLNILSELSIRTSDRFDSSVTRILLDELALFRNDLYWIEQHSQRGDQFAIPGLLTRASFLQRALQLSFLADGRPYPYRKWIWKQMQETSIGKQLSHHAQEFAATALPYPVTYTVSHCIAFYDSVVTLLHSQLPNMNILPKFRYDSDNYYNLLK